VNGFIIITHLAIFSLTLQIMYISSITIFIVLVTLFKIYTCLCISRPPLILYGQNEASCALQIGIYLTAVRSSCDTSPEACVTALNATLHAQCVETGIMNLPFSSLASALFFAQEYGTTFKTVTWLKQIGIDDFVGTFLNWCDISGITCENLTLEIINYTKQSGRKFVVTIYAEELGELLNSSHFIPDIRNQIDVIHLYFQHSANAALFFEQYVIKVQQEFPHADIIAGAYVYDRIDYVNCSTVPNQPCTPTEQLNYYNITLHTQLQLWNNNLITGIEWYPGYVGFARKIPEFNRTNECKNITICVARTLEMQNLTLEVLDITINAPCVLQ